MQSVINSPIIGYHHSPLTQKFGMPRQPNLTSVSSYIEMVSPFNTVDAFIGIEAFSHLWITWHAHHNREQSAFKPKVRPPRLGGNTKLGVFATRSTYRPSQLGLSVVQLVNVIQTETGVVIEIMGADMIDATPIIDIKPYIVYSDAIAEAKSGFADTKPLLKAVEVTAAAQKRFDEIVLEHSKYLKKDTILKAGNTSKSSALEDRSTSNCDSIKDSAYLRQRDLTIICELIAQDPRPAYRQSDTEHVFIMRYKQVDIGFRMDADSIIWIESVTTIDH